MKVELGHSVVDRLTGFIGIATGVCEYITGCNQVLVQPMVNKEGAFVESRWFDEDRLQIKPGPKFALNVSAPGPDKHAPRK